jgi:hypothetical protein
MESPLYFLVFELPRLPLHFAWLVVFVVGILLAMRKSRSAGGLLVGSAVLYGVGSIGRIGQTLAYSYADLPEAIMTIIGIGFTVLTILQYSMLVAAIWIDRRPQ